MLPIEKITQEALALPTDLKVRLVEQLIESLESSIDKEIQSAWISEAKQRKNEAIDGIIEVIPGDEALAEVRKMIQL